MRKLLLSISFLFIFILMACETSEDPTIKITTTLFPYHDIARALATDDMEVELVLPPGTDPHEFDPSPFQLVNILESDLFIYNSDDFEYWVNNIKSDLVSHGIKSLEMASFVTPYVSDHDHHDHDHHDHDHHDHDHHDHGDQDSAAGYGEIEEFEVLNRGDNLARVAYVHGDHWHGRLPNVEVGDRLSLGANIVSVGGRERELDADGEVNGFDVRLAPGAAEGIVELVNHGDHVHIRGVAAGTTMVQFIWTHRGEVRFITPEIRVVVEDEVDDHGHTHGMFDPHIWTDPLNLIVLTSVIRDALIELAPESADEITANAQAYIDELQEIHIAYSNWMTTRTTNVMMHGGHNAFAYFAARYNITFVNAYRGFSSDAEPTPVALQSMIQTMNETQATHLFSETLLAQNVANTIASETGAEILQLYSFEQFTQEEYNNGITIFDMFRHNLEQFKTGMGPRD